MSVSGSFLAGLAEGISAAVTRSAALLEDSWRHRLKVYSRWALCRILGLLAALIALIWLSIGAVSLLATIWPIWAACFGVSLLLAALAALLLTMPIGRDGARVDPAYQKGKEFPHETQKTEL